VRENHPVLLKLYAEFTAGKFFEDRAGYFDAVFFTQSNSSGSYSLWSSKPLRDKGDIALLDHSLKELSDFYVSRLQSFWPTSNLEFHLGAFVQASITLRLYSGEVDKNILPILTLDEAKAFGCVKPLYCTFFSH